MRGFLFAESIFCFTFVHMRINIILIIIYSLYSGSCIAQEVEEFKVRTGAEMLIENHLDELEGKRVGLVMNPTARIANVHVLDTLLALDVNITSLFAPEHGFRGDYADGEVIEGGIDQASGLPVYSLYGATKRPTEQMLENVDILLFDMQDVGARFYTYNSTMKYIIEAATEFDKEVWILDRPNPAGGNYISGWVLEDEYRSFIGSYPIPVAHGLTLGELALMAKGEGWLEVDKEPNLKVIKMKGWRRSMKWPETGLPWIPPSPNLPTFEHAYVYLGTCFFEGVNISEGRGTEDPFLMIGSPAGLEREPDDIFLNSIQFLEDKYHIDIDTVSFTTRSIPGKAVNPKFEGELIHGVAMSITPEFDQPVEFGLDLLSAFAFNISFDEHKLEVRDHLYLLSGTEKIDDVITRPYNWGAQTGWGASFTKYEITRGQYLLYY